MRRNADEIVAAGRALIGARFLPQGRSPTGLDCVGLVAAALGVERVPRDYALRGGSATRLAEELAKAGLGRADSARAGDVLVMRSGAAQLHLGIFTGAGLIHGDAGLRRVAERPGAIPWPILSIWRRREWQP